MSFFIKLTLYTRKVGIQKKFKNQLRYTAQNKNKLQIINKTILK